MKTLKFDTKYPTNYCIPLWVRDEQIKLALGRTPHRIQAREPHEGKVAVVGYGPSLQQELEKLRDFDTIISCSGATRFLIDRGIVPRYHVAVDPLPGHTVKLIGEPHPNVEYLISSTCHQDVFDHLEGKRVVLWHVFSTEEEALRTLPKGEWALTGGCDVGMRCITIARFFGFCDVHIFGIDGSYPEGSGRHAGEHPVPQKGAPVDYMGKTFFTTAAMLESAKMVFHELNQLSDVQPTFYGDALVQEMAKHYERKPPLTKQIAFVKPALISTEYAELNRQLHRSNVAYGVGGGKHADTVIKLAQSLKTQSILDYGCGKGYLAKAIPFPIWEYDPAIPGKEEAPRPADLVVCTDVLEHIERDKLGFVLDDLRRCVKQVGYFIIHTGPSAKVLADGRNAHLIQEGTNWWRNRLLKFFTIAKIFEVGPLLHVIVAPPKKKQKTKDIPVSTVAAPAVEEPKLEEVLL